MKALVMDSGILINLSMNGLLSLLEKLKEKFKGKLIITNQVRKEVVDRPKNIPRFELGALRVEELIEKGIIEFPSTLGISNDEILKETNIMMDKINSAVRLNNKKIKIVSEGEVSCLALSKLLTKKGIENIIAVDERTSRVVCENPENLEKIISTKIKKRVKVYKEELKGLSEFRFIRSSEIVFAAFKKNLINLKSKKTLEALLYATKYKGSSISFDEIKVLLKM